MDKKPRYYGYIPEKWDPEKPDPKLVVTGETMLEIKAKGCKLAHQEKGNVEVWNQRKALGDIKRRGKACRYERK